MRSKKLGINRRAARLAVPVLQLFAHEGKADVLFDEPQQVGFRNLIFQAEVVEQSFRAVVLPHHDQQASDDRNQTEHGRMLSSSMLPLNLILLIDVTFSTPTGVYTNYLEWPSNKKPCGSVSPRKSSLSPPTRADWSWAFGRSELCYAGF